MAGVERLTGSPNIREYTCTSATASFALNDLVKLDSSGTLVIATTGNILGIAKTKDPASLTTKVLVDVIYPDNSRFALRYKAAETAVSLGGEAATLTFTTTAITADDGGTTDVVIQEVDTREAVGTSGGLLIVTFKPAVLQAVTGF